MTVCVGAELKKSQQMRDVTVCVPELTTQRKLFPLRAASTFVTFKVSVFVPENSLVSGKT